MASLNKRRIFTLLVLLCLLSMLSACASAAATEPEPAPPPPELPSTPVSVTPAPPPPPALPPAPLFYDPLTGLVCNEELLTARPVAVMINNLKKALPQYGLSHAGIIYECMTEGQITRLLAVFNDYADVEKIGPVRSARHYFLDLAYNHGAMYAHIGGSPQAYSAIKSSKIDDLDGMTALDRIMYYRDAERLKQKGMYEHSAFTTGEGMVKGIEYKKYLSELKEPAPPAFLFSKEEYLPDGEKALKITVPHSSYITAVFVYDEKSGLYLRSQFGGPHIDAGTGEQLGFKNLFVIYAPEAPIKGDTAGRINVELTGKLQGIYCTGGVAIPITWEKTSQKEPARYTGPDGKELLVNPGKTFICILNSKLKADIAG